MAQTHLGNGEVPIGDRFTGLQPATDQRQNFKRLRRLFLDKNGDWPMVVANTRKVGKKCTRVSQILGQQEVYAKTSEMFYKAVFQLVLLFGLETWVVAPCLLRALGIFHNWVAWKIIGSKNWRKSDDSWVYPPIGEAPEEELTWPIKGYITQNRTQ